MLAEQDTVSRVSGEYLQSVNSQVYKVHMQPINSHSPVLVAVLNLHSNIFPQSNHWQYNLSVFIPKIAEILIRLSDDNRDLTGKGKT